MALTGSLKYYQKFIPSFEGCFVLGLLVFIISSCVSETTHVPEGKVLAQVGGTKLYDSQVPTFSEFPNASDSLLRAYVNNWLKQQALIEEAKKTLPPEQQDFDQELNNYKNSLLQFALEEQILKKELTKTIGDSAIEDYYTKNKKNFELKQNIVKVRYVKVPNKHKDLNKFKYFIQYKDSIKQAKFLSLIEEPGIFCEIKDSTWVELEELKQLVPLKLYNDEHFLAHYKYTEAPVDDYVWIVYFVEHKLKDEVSPLDLVRPQIENTILNKRKRALLKWKQQQFYNKAKKNGEIKVYLD